MFIARCEHSFCHFKNETKETKMQLECLTDSLFYPKVLVSYCTRWLGLPSWMHSFRSTFRGHFLLYYLFRYYYYHQTYLVSKNNRFKNNSENSLSRQTTVDVKHIFEILKAIFHQGQTKRKSKAAIKTNKQKKIYFILLDERCVKWWYFSSRCMLLLFLAEYLASCSLLGTLILVRYECKKCTSTSTTVTHRMCFRLLLVTRCAHLPFRKCAEFRLKRFLFAKIDGKKIAVKMENVKKKKI